MLGLRPLEAGVETAALRERLAGGGWRGLFDARSLQRGIEYARQGRILALAHGLDDDGRDILTAEVRGQANRIYTTTIGVQAEAGGVAYSGDCSCPVGAACKHQAAVLLFASRFAPANWPRHATPPALGSKSANSSAAAPARAKAPPVPNWMLALQQDMQAQAHAADLQARAEVAAARPANAMAAWDHWLQRVSDTSEPALVHAPAERRFGLLLSADAACSPAALMVSAVWLRPAKTRHGGLVDAKPLEIGDNGPEPAPRGGWADTDLAPLALLVAQQSRIHGGKFATTIEGAHDEQALLSLMQRHSAYWETARHGALTLSPALPLALDWQDHANGDQRLRASVPAAAGVETRVLRGAGLWYVQPQAQRFGRIDAPPHLLELVHDAPVLAPEQVKALQRRLGKSKRGIAIPPPAERGPIRRITAQPRAVLRVRATDTAWRRHYQQASLTVGCARLVLDYDGILIAPSHAASTRIMHDGALVEIGHDHAAEDRIEQTLEETGLIDAGLYAREQRIYRHAFDDHDFLLQPDEDEPPLAPETWQPTLAELTEQGFRIEYEAGFAHDTLLDIDAWHADVSAAPGDNTWFDVSLGIDVGGERVDLLPLLRRALADPTFSMTPGKGEKADATLRVRIDAERTVDIALGRLRTLIEPLLEWLSGDSAAGLRLHRSQADALLEMATAAQLPWRGGDLLRASLDALRAEVRSGDEPAGFATTLRGYQRDGLAWLTFLADAGLGGVLADDMGLGKTVQVLAHVLAEKQRGRLVDPALVVAPTSLVGNWRDEAARFAPALRVVIIHGANRADDYAAIADSDLVITTYPLLPRDREKLIERRFALLILDEAQAIKNPRSLAARVVRELIATRRLAMTGTPLENHLGELWAQFDAVEPGLLGSERQFTRFYRTPIEKHGDTDRQQRLNRRINLLLLRRRKEDVLAELPAKTEIVHRLELEGDQREFYETLRLAQHERVRQAVSQRGLAQSGIVVLDALLKLRQVCCDPRLVKLEGAKRIKRSAKFDALFELLANLLDEGRRILLFSQFTEMLELIAHQLDARKITYLQLTGQTPGKHRGALVREFQSGAAPVFLISLKAGGVGLNLTAADAVIHYDPWWNPAVETQASDRAHRIGQDKPVFVYKLIASGTVEEKIQALQMRKAELARAVLEGGASQRLKLDEGDLAELFAPLD